MNILAALRFAWQKSRILRRINRELGSRKLRKRAAYEPSVRARIEVAEERLFDLIERDPALAKILAKHRATRALLRQIYETLMMNGAGRWASGHWVPGSAIVFRAPLEFLLSRTPRGFEPHEDEWPYISDRVVSYFTRGGGGGV